MKKRLKIAASCSILILALTFIMSMFFNVLNVNHFKELNALVLNGDPTTETVVFTTNMIIVISVSAVFIIGLIAYTCWFILKRNKQIDTIKSFDADLNKKNLELYDEDDDITDFDQDKLDFNDEEDELNPDVYKPKLRNEVTSWFQLDEEVMLNGEKTTELPIDETDKKQEDNKSDDSELLFTVEESNQFNNSVENEEKENELRDNEIEQVYNQSNIDVIDKLNNPDDTPLTDDDWSSELAKMAKLEESDSVVVDDHGENVLESDLTTKDISSWFEADELKDNN